MSLFVWFSLAFFPTVIQKNYLSCLHINTDDSELLLLLLFSDSMQLWDLLVLFFCLLFVDSAVIEMSLGWLIVNFEKQSHSHFHSVGVNEVSFASDHERTSWQKLSSRRRFRNLFRIHPPGSRNNLCLPGLWPANSENSSFFQSIKWHSNILTMALNDCRCGSSVIRMHVKIAWFHVSFDEEFILVRVFTRNDKVTLWCDEPCELFEPKHFSLRQILTEHFVFLFLNFLQSFFLCQFQHLLTCLFCPYFLLIVFLFAVVVHCGICVSVVIDVNFDRKKFKHLFLADRVSKKDCYLPFENVKFMNHVGQWVTILFAFTHHTWNIVPWVPVVFHGLDNLDYSIHIGNVFFNVLSLEFVNILLFLKFPYSFILVFLDLVVFLPCNTLDMLLFFVLILFIVLEI